MSPTLVSLETLRKQVPHLTEQTEEGHVLKWESGDSGENTFEIECRGGTAAALKHLDHLVSAAHEKASVTLL